jgi:hypothetical protein
VALPRIELAEFKRIPATSPNNDYRRCFDSAGRHLGTQVYYLNSRMYRKNGILAFQAGENGQILVLGGISAQAILK